MADDKRALAGSAAGMRLIALLTIYNSGDDMRLENYFSDSLHAELKAQMDAPARTRAMIALRAVVGKLRVRQAIGTAKEHVIVMLASEAGVDVLVELRVDPDYPHPITEWGVTQLGAVTGSSAPS
jgi:hypothetical protein